MSRAVRVTLATLVLSGCAPQEPPPPAEARQDAVVRDGLGTTLRIARACVGGAPIAGEGEGGSPLRLEAGMVIAPTTDGRWSVHFGEEAPQRSPHGAEVEVDPAAGSCGGRRWPLPAGAATGPSLSALLTQAHACATSISSTGVGGTPLRTTGIQLSVLDGGRIVASVPEAEARTRPSGRDVVLDADGSGCSPAPMD